MSKLLAKVVVGSRLHETATPESDWDYRGIFVDDLKEALSPFRNHKTTSWIEGDEDNTSYELREFCKLATKGNATIWEVLKSDKIIETSFVHKYMSENWLKFMDTQAFINASLGYARNQQNKFGLYDDLGDSNQRRTAKFVIAFLRVMWQCEQFLLTGEFKCSLETCDMYDFIKGIKGKPRENLDIPLCYEKMEMMYHRITLAQQQCPPERLNLKPDYDWIERMLLFAYVPNCAGIYVIKNKITGQSYVGQTLYLNKRRRDHFSALRRGKHPNKKLQTAFDKYGADSFVWDIIDIHVPCEDLDELEEKAIKELSGFTEGYNQTPFAVNTNKGKPMKEDTKAKISRALMGNKNGCTPRDAEARRHMSEVRCGKKSNYPAWNKGLTKADHPSLEKLSQTKKGHLVSEKTRVKISESLKAYRKKLK